ncbi:18672_t:CDS:1, partial [Acaulospora morrowiae]
FYVIKAYTPGVRRKDQIQIQVSDDDKSVVILAENQTDNSEFTEIKNNLSNKFEINVVLPKT